MLWSTRPGLCNFESINSRSSLRALPCARERILSTNSQSGSFHPCSHCATSRALSCFGGPSKEHPMCRAAAERPPHVRSTRVNAHNTRIHKPHHHPPVRRHALVRPTQHFKLLAALPSSSISIVRAPPSNNFGQGYILFIELAVRIWAIMISKEAVFTTIEPRWPHVSCIRVQKWLHELVQLALLSSQIACTNQS